MSAMAKDMQAGRWKVIVKKTNTIMIYTQSNAIANASLSLIVVLEACPHVDERCSNSCQPDDCIVIVRVIVFQLALSSFYEVSRRL